jgi:hypothetical protein
VIATLLTIVFLIAMWVAVLAAPVLRNRSSAANRPGNRGGDSIKTFQRQLATLEKATPYRAPLVRSSGASRRAASVGRPETARPSLTAGLALTVSGWFVLLHLLTDGLLVAYVVLLTRTLRLAAEREMKVAFLPHRNPGAEPTALLQQAAGRGRG